MAEGAAVVEAALCEKKQQKKPFSSGRCPVQKLKPNPSLSSLECDYSQGAVLTWAPGRGSTKTKGKKNEHTN